jgi:predicted DNA-binding antitoxin AbrB/MazE fold protein
MTPNTLEAVVEGGVLRPLKQLELPEQLHVLVTVVAFKDEVRKAAVSCYEMAVDLGVIGSAEETASDLSTNPVHLTDFGN